MEFSGLSGAEIEINMGSYDMVVGFIITGTINDLTAERYFNTLTMRGVDFY